MTVLEENHHMSAGPEWILSEDRQTVTVTFSTDPPVVLKLDASGVEQVLARLGDLRAVMASPIAADFATGQTVQAVQNPRWTSEPDALMGNSVFHLRDPRFGWLHYVLPRETAAKLGQLLIAQSDAPPPGLGRDRPN